MPTCIEAGSFQFTFAGIASAAKIDWAVTVTGTVVVVNDQDDPICVDPERTVAVYPVDQPRGAVGVKVTLPEPTEYVLVPGTGPAEDVTVIDAVAASAPLTAAAMETVGATSVAPTAGDTTPTVTAGAVGAGAGAGAGAVARVGVVAGAGAVAGAGIVAGAGAVAGAKTTSTK